MLTARQLEEAAAHFADSLAEKKLIELRAAREAKTRLELDDWTEPNYESIEAMPVTRPNWLITDTIEHGTVGFLSGIYGSAKSFLALDWACSVATGLTWCSHTVQRGKVIYIAAEGSLGIGRRYAAWKTFNDHAVRADNMDVILSAVQLGHDLAMDWLVKRVVEFEADFIIIDTLARSVNGLNENDAVDMGKVITAAQRLRDARGENMTTVLIIHHTGWGDKRRTRGSTRLPSDADFSYITQKGDLTKPFTLSCDKLKEEMPPPDWSFNLKIVDVAEGVTSCVIQEAVSWTPPADDPQSQDITTQAGIITALKIQDGQTNRQLQDSTGAKQPTVSHALTGLKETGKVRCERDEFDTRSWHWYLAGSERSQIDKLARPNRKMRV